VEGAVLTSAEILLDTARRGDVDDDPETGIDDIALLVTCTAAGTEKCTFCGKWLTPDCLTPLHAELSDVDNNEDAFIGATLDIVAAKRSASDAIADQL
jgi:hypothetical protein